MSAPRNLADLLERLPSDVLSFVRAAGRTAREMNTSAALVGGVVRDLLLGRPLPPDADVMVEPPSTPVAEALAREFGARLVRHPRFQTFRLELADGKKYDVVTAREERYAAPAALPDVVASTFEKDLSRRDFTINAMMCRLDPGFGDLHDPLGGLPDLDARKIRALHAASFSDDPTRIFRAARFAGRLGFEVETDTAAWIRASMAAGTPDRLSPVRRRHELELILGEESPSAALAILRGWGALRYFHPAWNGLEDAALDVDAAGTLPERLARLFGAAGADEAERSMTALSFEKAMKRDVASRLRR